jgi:hypothetical protein
VWAPLGNNEDKINHNANVRDAERDQARRSSLLAPSAQAQNVPSARARETRSVNERHGLTGVTFLRYPKTLVRDLEGVG